MRLGILIAAGMAAVLSAVSLAATRGAHVSVASRSPTTITGAGFRERERVTVTVSAKTSRTKRVVATSRGGFRATFKGFTIARCVPYTVRAKGNRGSIAVLKVVPECAPARVETTTDPGLPSDPPPKKGGH